MIALAPITPQNALIFKAIRPSRASRYSECLQLDLCFHQRLGFTLTGRTEPYANDPALIEYEMSRPIS